MPLPNLTTPEGYPRDFHTLTSSEVEAVLEEANELKYRAPKNANGSRARYYWQKLQREYRRDQR